MKARHSSRAATSRRHRRIRERIEGADIISRAVRRKEAMRVIADRAQIPSGDAEIRREFMTCLHIERLLERRDLVSFKDGARRLDDIADDLAQTDARRIGAVFNVLLQCRANCLLIVLQNLGHAWIDSPCFSLEIGICTSMILRILGREQRMADRQKRIAIRPAERGMRKP